MCYFFKHIFINAVNINVWFFMSTLFVFTLLSSCDLWIMLGTIRKIKGMQPFTEDSRGPYIIFSTLLGDDSCFLSVQTPRVCDDYWSEYRHCKSLWNRFHHYYTYGASPSCQQWKEDYHNCKEWEKHRTTEAKVQLLELILFKDLNLWSF